MTFDLLIRGGTVIDGSGSPGRQADVGVAGGLIGAVGALAGAAAREVWDAAGRVVAPGFIDLHNHSEGWLLRDGVCAAKLSQGITCEVLFPDGIGYAPVTADNWREWLYYLRGLNGLGLGDYRGWHSIEDYLQALDGRTAQHAAAQIPYANVRVAAMGWGRHAPDDSQMRHIQRQIAEALDAGAVGLSTGLDYISQCFASTDELVEACRPVAARDRLYVTHVRYKKGVLEGVREAVEIGRRAGVRVHVSHLKAATAEEAERLLEYLDRVAVHEVDFSFDVYPYLPGSTMLNALLPYEVWEDGPLAAAGKLARSDVRRRFAAALDEGVRNRLTNIRFAWMPGRDAAPWIGRSLAEYVRASGRAAEDTLCDLLLEQNLAVLCVFDLGDDRLVEPFLRHPRFLFGSDGIDQPEGRVHPRQFGAATRLLGRFVRERQVLTLEEAVRHMTSLPAARFGLGPRGVVRAGAAADLVLFDPATIGDRATFEEPRALSTGVEAVLVGGVPVWRGGAALALGAGRGPGRALRHAAAPQPCEA